MKKVILAILIMTLAIVVITPMVQAATYSVYIKDPTDPANGALGVLSSGYWVGQIPIQITSGTSTYQALGYCINYTKVLYIGTTYDASPAAATDNAVWRAISYVLSWYNPTNKTEAAIQQVAIWRLLGPSYERPSWLNVNIDNAGAALASTAIGKDVIRQGDTFTWISPITTNGTYVKGNPGDTTTFIAQLKSSEGIPRANVKIQFAATLNGAPLDSAYMTPTEAFTDSQGIVQVNVNVPADAAYGSIVEVKASTKSVWPQQYVDVSNCGAQDLILTGTTLNLTLKTNVCILGGINVVPEVPLGTIVALLSIVAGFVSWKKLKK